MELLAIHETLDVIGRNVGENLVVLDEVQQGGDGLVVEVENGGLDGVTEQLTTLGANDDVLELLQVVLSHVLKLVEHLALVVEMLLEHAEATLVVENDRQSDLKFQVVLVTLVLFVFVGTVKDRRGHHGLHDRGVHGALVATSLETRLARVFGAHSQT